MLSFETAERLRHDFAPMTAVPTRTALIARIERLADEVARRAPDAGAQADEILALAGELRVLTAPNRDAIIEAIEDVCGDDLSGCCVSRIATAVVKVCGGR